MSRSLLRNLAKDGLMEDGYEDLLERKPVFLFGLVII